MKSASEFVSFHKESGTWSNSVVRATLAVFEELNISTYSRYDLMLPHVRGAFLMLTRRKINGSSTYFGPTRQFFFVHSPRVLEELYDRIPAPARCFEEVIAEQTPHRFHMDIECELVEHAQSLSYLRSFLFERVIPFLVKVFNEEWAIGCCTEDWLMLNASLEGKKYSMHAFLLSKYFCDGRLKSWIVGAILQSRFEDEAKADEEFSRWYYLNSGNQKTIVDWSIYSKGKRNFRIIGSCKPVEQTRDSGSGPTRLSLHYDLMRPLRPDPQPSTRPWTDFLATQVLSDQSVPFPMPNEGQRERIKRLVVGGAKHFSGLCNVLGLYKSFVSRSSGGGGSLISTAEEGGGGDACDERQERIAHLIECMNTTNSDLFTLLRTRFRAFAESLHPGNTVSEIQPTRYELMRLRMSVFVQGLQRRSRPGKQQRLCFFSYEDHEDRSSQCESGDHAVAISLQPDLSIKYYCWACKKERTIVMSPLGKDKLIMESPMVERPLLFEKGFVDYDEDDNHVVAVATKAVTGSTHTLSSQLTTATTRQRYMSGIEPFADTDYYFVPKRERTIILHAGMGTGKSTIIAEYLDRVRVDVKSLLGRDARIISISFRQMLAQSTAHKFKLNYYKDDVMPHVLFDCNCLAIQLDSLVRITDNGEHLRMRSFDVVIIDESESVLSHVSSTTMTNKRNVVFRLLTRLTQQANTVIAADADIGIRTRFFVRETRKRSMDNGHYHIPSSLYARNRYVGSDIEYLDYMCFGNWLNELVRLLVDEQKNVFLCTNAKGNMHNIKNYVMEKAVKKLEELERNNVFNVQSVFLGELLSDDSRMIFLDAEIDGQSKKDMAENCNNEWKKAWILGITPVVGAGLSFDVAHFHEAFVFGCKMSAPPRGLLQLLGRVRVLLNKRVHLYIDVKSDTEEEYTVSDAQHEISSRVVTRLEADSLYHETVEHDETTGLTETRYKIPEPDRLLAHIVALNRQEQVQGERKFRLEFIRILLQNNQNLQYRFIFENNKCFFDDLKLFEKLDDFKQKEHQKRTLQLLNQRDLDSEELHMAKRRNARGVMVSEDPEEQKNAEMIIQRNEIQNTFNIRVRLLPEAAQAKFFSFFDHRDKVERVKDAACLIFTAPLELCKNDNGQQEILLVTHDENNDFVDEEMLPVRSAEHDFTNDWKAFYTQKILYLAGFNCCGSTEASEHPFTAHDSEAKKRIKKAREKQWFDRHVDDIYNFLGLPKKGAWNKLGLRQINKLAKQVFRVLFGAKFSRPGSLRATIDSDGEDDDDDEEEGGGRDQKKKRPVPTCCGSFNHDPKKGCREWRIEDEFMYTVLCHMYLRKEGAKWAENARNNFERLVIVPQNNIVAFTETTTFHNHDDSSQLESSDSTQDETTDKKKTRHFAKYKEFVEMWDNIRSELVFSDERLLNDPFSCCDFFRQPSVQAHWLQNQSRAIQSMQSKIARKRDETHGLLYT